MKINDSKLECCGCRACEQICPNHCISMMEDENGFLYPKIDEKKCTHCNLCKQICPVKNNSELKNEHTDCYMLIHKDENIISKSSSGGAFTAIVQAILNTLDNNEKYKIYGCYMDENLKVKHKGIEDVNNIEIFRKSKYVQSDLDKIYTYVKKDLIEGKTVIFSGTPCQVAGLKSFTKDINTEKLYLIDLVCHGVPNQKIFDKYIKCLERKYKGKIVKYSFKNKIKVGNVIDNNAIQFTIKKENGKTKIINRNWFKDEYMITYMCSLLFRPSCEECKFCTEERVSDITIGDFWGIQRINKKLNPSKGISLVLINSNKGNKLLEQIRENSILELQSFETAKKDNENLKTMSQINENQEKFFKELQTKDFNKLATKYTRKKGYIEFIITENLNKDLRKMLMNLKYNIKKIIKR